MQKKQYFEHNVSHQLYGLFSKTSGYEKNQKFFHVYLYIEIDRQIARQIDGQKRYFQNMVFELDMCNESTLKEFISTLNQKMQGLGTMYD